ncbi:MAG: type II toxin-antitoxin system RelE/ParE family toxin [Nitrospira sp.]|nr:type II toxin-antitoxin system RelE/ParE family toxin [Nitrospira sp.]MBP6607173.1 type II toxin-antitoxin system RelE/ParE family toxin [Nitrospira sp.]HQY58877.1 type II toxin-antitoxin system RelE/ParE family toxin [Nitrospira sp.]HRA96258.1 type II toxin-antitoxin system RelE/ParE family toxin [Nitrospira sp.]
MSHPLPVRIVGSAGQAIVDAAEWWVSNRPKAPDTFAIELERAIQILASQPLIGSQARNVKLAGVRRLHLPRVRYYLYYRVISHPEVVEILALWHTSRGISPNLL